MSEISLPPFHMTTMRKILVEINHDLAQDLERYRTFYKRAYGAEVSESDLLREMARRFLEADHQFQAQKHGIKTRPRSRRPSNSSASPEQEANETV